MSTRGRKPGLTPELHIRLGAELAAIHDRLTALECEILNAFPARSAPGRLAGTGSRALFRLRVECENAMFSQYGDQPGRDWATTFVYWPRPEDRAAWQARREESR